MKRRETTYAVFEAPSMRRRKVRTFARLNKNGVLERFGRDGHGKRGPVRWAYVEKQCIYDWVWTPETTSPAPAAVPSPASTAVAKPVRVKLARQVGMDRAVVIEQSADRSWHARVLPAGVRIISLPHGGEPAEAVDLGGVIEHRALIAERVPEDLERSFVKLRVLVDKATQRKNNEVAPAA